MKIIMLRSNSVNPDPRVEKEVAALKEQFYDVELICWDRARNYSSEKGQIDCYGESVTITRFGIEGKFGGGFKANLIPLIKFQIKIFYWLICNRKEYKIIHACDFDTAFIGFIAAKLFRKKIIYDIFDYYVDAFSVPEFLKKIIKTVDDFIISNVNGVIICSEKRIEQIAEAQPKMLSVIHNTPPIICNDSYSIELLSKSNKVKFAYIGVLQRGRYIEELIEVIKNRNDCELHIGGFGILEEIIKQEVEQTDNIFFYGKVSYKQAISIEMQCDVMTALYEPSIPNHRYIAPNKFYEALMLGKPILMINNTGMDDVIEKYQIGEIIDYNISALKKGIDQLILRKHEWNNISVKMKNIYKSEFSWDIMKKRLINLYLKILNQ